MRKRSASCVGLCLAAIILASACGAGGDETAAGSTIGHANYDPASLSAAEISAAAALDVYFEHASVGQHRRRLERGFVLGSGPRREPLLRPRPALRAE